MRETLPLFNLGRVVASSRVSHFAEESGIDLVPLLRRHHAGDWGEVCKEDWKTNDSALSDGGRILSSYTVRGTRFWVITEADREHTTILFPDDY
jgi:hypothetical protein